MSIVVDCTSSPSIASLKAADVSGVCRYLSWLHRWGGKTHVGINSKIIQKPEFDRLIANRISVTLNWEFDDHDWLGGGSAAREHAAEAIKQAKALGYPKGCTIIGSADFDMTSAEWGSAGRAYALAFADTIRDGGYLPGVYAAFDVLGWCHKLAVFSVFWQAGMSKGWSGGRNAKRWPGAHLRQLRHEDIGGIDCDVNEILQAAYGQHQPWHPVGGPITEEGDMDAHQAAELANVSFTLTNIPHPSNPGAPRIPLHVWASQQTATLSTIQATLAASSQREQATLAAIHALAGVNVGVDTAAVLARIDAVAAIESQTVAGLQLQLAAAQASINELTAKLTAADNPA